MSFINSFGRARLSLLCVGVLLGACGDDGDTSSDDQAQSADGGSTTGTNGSRAGTSGGSRAGSGSAARGGNGGSAANNSASAGRSGGAGRNAPGSGRGRGGSGGSAGLAANGGNGGSTQTPNDQDAGDASRMSLTDGEIAAVLSAVNTAETGAGTFALTRASTPAAREFAQSMVEMHNTAKERQTALFNTLDLTLMPSALSTQLTDQSTATMTQLMSLSDTEFDAAYLRSQADAHMAVLMIIDEQLLPNVVADTLRAELVLTRTTVAAHLDAARLAVQGVQEDTDAGVPLTP